MKKNIPLARPDITAHERKKVLDVLRTSSLALGPKLEEFENKFVRYIGCKHAVAVNSGTSALHLIVRALGLKDGDEVITTPFSFIASANCVLFERARPVFVDIEPDTLNIDPFKIAAAVTRRTKAILAVDVFGHPADWDALRTIARKHRLLLIEDSCEALGSEYKGKKAGRFGVAGAFAFYPNKQITTGEGGMIVTDDKKLAAACRSMRNQGRGGDQKWLEHVRLGFNYRISDINCALGIAQMGRIDILIKKREEVRRLYQNAFKDVEEIELPQSRKDVKTSWFVYVVRLKPGFSLGRRDQILSGLRKKNIACSNYFPPIHLQPLYRKSFGYRSGDFPVTEDISRRVIALPFYNQLTPKDIRYIMNSLKTVIQKIKRSQL